MQNAESANLIEIRLSRGQNANKVSQMLALLAACRELAVDYNISLPKVLYVFLFSM